MATPVVRVGVAAVVKDASGRMVVGVRKGNSHGIGHWQFPGGHLEFGETPLQCAERETLEETGLQVRAEKIVAVTNDIFQENNKHYITLFVVCQRCGASENQEPMTLEPEKCEGWSWKTWDEIKELFDRQSAEGGSRQQTLFLPIVNLIKDYPNIQDLM
ncbi:NUDIX hydrolase domain-like protein [Podospora aff. communis PSN243]|uniref:NUDIX hydrolase domain-like protein n=1 Tax=Podospora aff. communis PSN243 TaxID=3040156 RepID=A0AAV9GFF6_9PEZI|nr:NUDIX hydrolase domain-like protein [Podospora aff. communis PSN243]